MIIRTGLGQDSHRFVHGTSTRGCVLGGLTFEDAPDFVANSDGDVVFHAICNAISSLIGIRILGGIADDLCLKDGITDSAVYLQEGLKLLRKAKQTISHCAISIEAKKPKFGTRIDELRKNVADTMRLELSQVGITATSGEGLTDFGLGEGVQVFCILTTVEN